ncbi:MAG: methyltransferase domain-containing protein [Acidobacteria bacterium]|nr:methyltransferase domain-containing protein [Acidobacteriota bacterium]
MNNWLFENLICPRDRSSLKRSDGGLVCENGHIYPVISDVPIMLIEEAESTHDYIKRTFEAVKDNSVLTEADRSTQNTDAIDPFVQGEIPYTSGILYFSVQNRLERYPIPHLRLPEGNGATLLDIGCNWGRWCVAAGRLGYRPIGIDPSLRAVLAAKRVCKQLGVEADFVVGDCRFLPFRSGAFDTVFSYGVYQHLSKDNTKISIEEAARVLKPDGNSLIQMPNVYGLRQFYNYWRRGFSEGEGFDIRYWKPSEILSVFERLIGPTKMTADCYFGLGLQSSDADLFPVHYRFLVRTSEAIRKVSDRVKPLARAADSVYLYSTKN